MLCLSAATMGVAAEQGKVDKISSATELVLVVNVFILASFVANCNLSLHCIFVMYVEGNILYRLCLLVPPCHFDKLAYS